jgi:tetratricopeptide (TPR) repeat protein/tRNA A-37 threonylcarbamoyl transferase component Bud32
MGIVYEAVQESLGRHVALKVIHHLHLDARRRQRFQREAQAVAQLHHTNIVPIFGASEHEGLPYYVMQFIRGSGLDALLRTWRDRDAGAIRGDDRWRFVARVGVQAAEALQYAHEQGILHRDIKPANLLIDEQGVLWITDFGLAKLTGHDDLTASGDVIGTLRYLAPEALRGETDPRSDVYSLGLTLYELITLSPPFGELSPSELLRHVGESEPTRPRRLDPNIPGDLETIVLKAIAREPGHRYATAGELAQDLRCFLEDRPIRARRATTLERAWRWSRRNKMTAALAATAAGSLLLAAILGWVGYMSTMRALVGESMRRSEAEGASRRAEQASRRAEENVALSLEVFGELFNQLAGRDNLLAPPTGQRRRAWPRDGGPPPPPGGPGPGHRPPPRPGFGGDPFAPDHGPGPGPGPGGEPPWEAPREPSEHDAALLRSILTFYDRFARRNAKDPRLQAEAAWAYRKVAALSERLGRDREAEQANLRAIAMLEELVAQFPGVAEYRSKLVETYIMVDPWSVEPSALEGLDTRLRRARELVDQLARESPGNLAYTEVQVHVYAKLGVVAQRLMRPDEAEADYHRALDLEESIIARAPRSERARLDRVDTRGALATLAIERGRRDEARALLDAAAVDLQSLAAGRMPTPPLADRFENLGEAFAQLGDRRRAEEMTRQAGRADERPHRSRPRPEPEPEAP